jgi:hypothetical protein
VSEVAVASGAVASVVQDDVGAAAPSSDLVVSITALNRSGEIVYDDTGKALLYYVTEDGEPRDVHTATSVSLQMVRGATSVNIDGAPASTISDDSALEFSAADICAALSEPASRIAPDVYDCRVSFYADGEVRHEEPFRLAIVRWP